jgi:hypothetical protein
MEILVEVPCDGVIDEYEVLFGIGSRYCGSNGNRMGI